MRSEFRVGQCILAAGDVPIGSGFASLPTLPAINTLGHDLKNLLSIISLNTSHLLQAADLGEQAHRLLEMNRNVAEHGIRVLRAMLATSTDHAPQASATTIDTLIADNAELLQAAVGPDIAVTFDLGAIGAQCSVDANRLVHNLLEMACNARDAMNASGSLRIATSLACECHKRKAKAALPNASGHEADPLLCIAFSDDGCGMEEGTARSAFQPAFTTKAEGTGTGLASLSSFASDFGGKASVVNNCGRGVTVALNLPVIPPRPETDGQATPQHRPAPTCRSILLVDDEAYALEALGEILTGYGFDVVAVETLAAAEEALAQRPFDLLLTDVTLGQDSGLDLARTCTARWPGMSIIVTSGWDYSTIACTEGATGWRFLPKPIDVGVLRELLGPAQPHTA